MVKKESAKRGYMTPEEIREKVDGFSSSDKKIRYLKNVIFNKQGLMSKGTRRSVYETLQNLYLEEGEIVRAEVTAIEGGLRLDKVRQAYEQLAKKVSKGEFKGWKQWDTIPKDVRRIGGIVNDALIFEGELFMRANDLKRAKKVYEDAATEDIKNGDNIEKFSQQIKEKVAGEGKRTEKFVGVGTDTNPIKGGMQLGDDAYPYPRDFKEIAKSNFGYESAAAAYVHAAKCYIRIGETEKADKLLKEKEQYFERDYNHLGLPILTRLEKDVRESIRPSPELKLNEGFGKFFRERKNRHTLEKKILASISMGGFISSIFFLSANITGNVIGSLNYTLLNWTGGILFILGLIGVFLYFKRK